MTSLREAARSGPAANRLFHERDLGGFLPFADGGLTQSPGLIRHPLKSISDQDQAAEYETEEDAGHNARTGLMMNAHFTLIRCISPNLSFSSTLFPHSLPTHSWS